MLKKDFRGQLVYEFHQKALKHISHGVTLSNLPCWVKYRSLLRQQVLVLLAEMQEVIYRDSIADRIFLVHFFLWHSDKVICISNWKQLPSFWCNIVSINDALKRRWKAKELQENEKKNRLKLHFSDWPSCEKHAPSSKWITALGRKTNWTPVVPRALLCHIKEGQRNSVADGCTMSQDCLSEATDAGT